MNVTPVHQCRSCGSEATVVAPDSRTHGVVMVECSRRGCPLSGRSQRARGALAVELNVDDVDLGVFAPSTDPVPDR